MLKQIVLVLVASGFISSSAYAKEKLKPTNIPWFELPQRLKPYADLDRVLATARSTINLMATTRFDISKDKIRTSCQNDKILSVYRGAVMTLGAHKAFINKMEIGWPSMNRSVAWTRGWDNSSKVWKKGDPILTHPSRALLHTAWPTSKLAQLFILTGDLKKLPTPIRHDLRAFLIFLLESHERWIIINKRANDSWRLVLRTQERDYIPAKFYAKSDAESKASLRGQDFDEEAFGRLWPGELFNTDLSPHLRKIYNSVRGPTDTAIDPCFDDLPGIFPNGYFDNRDQFRATFGNEHQLVIETFIGPTKYGIMFWQRRNTEGMVALTRYLLSRIISALD